MIVILVLTRHVYMKDMHSYGRKKKIKSLGDHVENRMRQETSQ